MFCTCAGVAYASHGRAMKDSSRACHCSLPLRVHVRTHRGLYGILPATFARHAVLAMQTARRVHVASRVKVTERLPKSRIPPSKHSCDDAVWLRRRQARCMPRSALQRRRDGMVPARDARLSPLYLAPIRAPACRPRPIFARRWVPTRQSRVMRTCIDLICPWPPSFRLCRSLQDV